MWNEHIYSNGDVMQLKNLAEIGIDIDNYEKIDEQLADDVSDKYDLVRERIEHIDAMIARLGIEKDMLERILRGELHEIAEHSWANRKEQG